MKILRRIRALGLCLLGLACGRIDTNVGAQFAREIDAAPVPQLPRSAYMEAESGSLSGFSIESDPTASGGEYILPPPGIQSLEVPGAASAVYRFAVASGTYLLWGRIRAPGSSNNAFWMTMDDGPSYLWQLSTGVTWYWGPVTDGTDYDDPIPFELDGGTHQLVVRNAEPEVDLDRLYVTSLGDVPPGNDTPCDPPNSIQLEDGGCEPSCGSHLNTTCGTAECAGQPLLVSYDCPVCCHMPADAGASD